MVGAGSHVPSVIHRGVERRGSSAPEMSSTFYPGGMETTFDHVLPFDGEHVGYIEISGDLFVPYDRMWQRRGEAMPLDEAEAILDSTGLSMLAEDWLLADDASENGAATRVRIQEITRDTVTVAPTVDSMSAEVAKSLDLTRTLRLDLPTDRLRLADPRP